MKIDLGNMKSASFEIMLRFSFLTISVLMFTSIVGSAGAITPVDGGTKIKDDIEWEDQIVYVLMPNKFSDGDPSNNYMAKEYQLPNEKYEQGYIGGDIKGISDHIDHLKSLGITSVLLSPVFDNDRQPLVQYLASGYRVRDYHAIDRNLGTVEEFRHLISDLHSDTNGERINVILDLPFALVGLEHPWAADKDKYPYYFREWDADNPSENIATYPTNAPYGPIDHAYGMAIVNAGLGMENGSGVYKYIRDDILFWLADHFDIDGFRYDCAQMLPYEFWRKIIGEFRQKYQSSQPGFLHIGEVFIMRKRTWQKNSCEYLDTDKGERLMDGIYDFYLLNTIQQVFAEGKEMPLLSKCLEEMARCGKSSSRMVTSIDNYDSPTFLNRVKDNNHDRRIRLAMTFLLTVNRIPFIYSGNEYGIDYSEPDGLFKTKHDNGFINLTKSLINLRKAHEAFRKGDMKTLYAKDNAIIYSRTYNGEVFLVALNCGDKSVRCELDNEFGTTKEISLENVFVAAVTDTIEPDITGDRILMHLSGWEGRILQVNPE